MGEIIRVSAAPCKNKEWTQNRIDNMPIKRCCVNAPEDLKLKRYLALNHIGQLFDNLLQSEKCPRWLLNQTVLQPKIIPYCSTRPLSLLQDGS
jgi:hypothetical protein